MKFDHHLLNLMLLSKINDDRTFSLFIYYSFNKYLNEMNVHPSA